MQFLELKRLFCSQFVFRNWKLGAQIIVIINFAEIIAEKNNGKVLWFLCGVQTPLIYKCVPCDFSYLLGLDVHLLQIKVYCFENEQTTHDTTA
jgi:hypothetical protein